MAKLYSTKIGASPYGGVSRKENMSENTFGKEVGLLHEVMVTGRKVGADHTFWSRLAHNRLLFERIVQFVNSNKGVGYQIEVDYGKVSPDELIKSGNYDKVEYLLDGRYSFPITRTGKHIVVIELWEEELGGDSDDKESLLVQLGYRHADLVELLTFAICYPKVIEQYYSIKALGTLSNKLPLFGRACTWVGRGLDEKLSRSLGVSFEERLSHGTYAVVKKNTSDTEVTAEPRLLAFHKVAK